MTHPEMLSCDEYRQFFEKATVVEDCDMLANGALRLKTVFKYPNGSWVDLFLDKTDDLFTPMRLSDYGETIEYLHHLSLNPLGTKKRKLVVSRICESLGVTFEEDELSLLLRKEDLPHASKRLVCLAQACLRMSEIQFTRQFRIPNSFRDEFEESVLSEVTSDKYESDYSLTGSYGNVVRVDFRVRGERSDNLIQTLSTGNTAAAHALATDIFAKWHDLSDFTDQHSFFSVYDSRNNAFKEEDISRLEQISTVLAFPAQAEAIQEALAA